MQREDGIDVVSIVTPNNVHFGPAKAFTEAGIHVILDKPLTTTLGEAIALEKIVRKSRLIFGLTHTYTGYPMDGRRAKWRWEASSAKYALSRWISAGLAHTAAREDWQQTSAMAHRSKALRAGRGAR